MDYHFSPFAEIWQGGIFNVPSDVADKYLKIAGEYQLKALLFVLRNGGRSSSSKIAKALGITAGDADDLLEFWTEEGVLTADGAVQSAPTATAAAEEVKPAAPKKEALPPPRLAPKDIVAAQRESDEIAFLLNEAQVILGRTISHAEQEMLVNMVNYYGLKVEIIMMILEFYRCEKERGKSVSISYVSAMAKNWSEEGISTIGEAEDKLRDIEQSDRRWNEIIAITGIRHKRPTDKQREMIADWFSDFDAAMISLAADIMKENIPEPKLAYMNKIIKKWRRQGISSPAQVKAQQQEFEKARGQKSSDKLKVAPTYDLKKVKEDIMNNTEI